ncbi:Serine/threonine-protein kinase PRR1 [Podospora fimiseda]|uniref:Serine/threonine-protein kinase PRR1 n=1 Tax=Podospora fimiseda TaxID=252190 RepID=A0AAN7BP31_9PEZI|nr:Serine/threonine-protein kinase PRR1 [Podospora fimiseda]
MASWPSQQTSERHDDTTKVHHVPLIDAAASIAAAGLVNKRNAEANSVLNITSSSSPTISIASASTPRPSPNPVQFCSKTIAPSPPQPLRSRSPSPGPGFTSSHGYRSPYRLSSLGENALRLQTDFRPKSPLSPDTSNGFATPSKTSRRPGLTLQHKSSSSSLRPISRTPSLKTARSLSGVFGSASAASSTVPSPAISAMGDVTPLPSPLLSSHSPGPWRQLRRLSREGVPFSPEAGDNILVTNPVEDATATPTRDPNGRKGYAGLSSGLAPPTDQGERLNAAHKPVSHTRNRSTSEYKPDPLAIPKRMTTVSGPSHRPNSNGPIIEAHMRREPHLSEARGLTPIEKPPTPPPSESSLSTTDLSSVTLTPSSKRSHAEYFEADGRYDKKRRRWRAIMTLGQGTFSRVMLATSQTSAAMEVDEDYSSSGLRTPEPPTRFERRSLVAVKVCEHGPRGGASEDRIEMSLKRELEIMRDIHHPSLVNLKAWSIEPTRAILVLSYYPGGDLFDLAAKHRSLLQPVVIRRIFSELVGAVSYLHGNKIVHRDIKLENVLVNLTPPEISSIKDWTSYPYPLVTLSDLGLSRRVVDDEKLETRCGSDDYAAPELIMGQPYDGRATDAWSLGVLLYALLEGRLPFDDPKTRMRSRVSHRIARAEWRWYEYGAKEGEDGEGDYEADYAKFDAKGLRGAMEIVEGLLKRARSRWPLAKVSENEWVKGGIQVEEGIKFREEEEGEEVL